ncbi:TetR/AcrR family transcriptional regulator [Emcibacter sp. SYSU 3D8]|uniref:TetR/AcrR family transcriptional regulator n=1 Tax=Emcibacter sp. SYSU 3D8 TaxID=3133969 RepID=UPI0031FE917A
MQHAKENCDPEHWQTTKSEFTRDSILRAIVDCLAEFGYSNLTLGQVARKAGLSKGAMQHHFESKSAAIEAALQFIFQQQLELQQSYARGPTEPTDDQLHGRRIDALWGFVQDPSYVAFLEIAMAGRTDPHLGALVNDQYWRFRQRARENAKTAMPEWQLDQEKFRVGGALVNYVLEGMALRQTLGLSEADTDAALRAHLKKMVAALFDSQNGDK